MTGTISIMVGNRIDPWSRAMKTMLQVNRRLEGHEYTHL